MSVNEVSIKMNNLPMAPAKSGISDKPEKPATEPQDGVEISDGKQEEKPSFLERVGKKIGGWIDRKADDMDKPKTTGDKIKSVLIQTAFGAAAGAGLIAMAASPVALGVIAGVVGGAVGLVAGGMVGGLLGGIVGAGRGDAGGGATTGALIGGIGGGAVGAGVAGLAGYADAHILVGMAAALGGGPVGGAIAGAIMTGAYATYSALASK